MPFLLTTPNICVLSGERLHITSLAMQCTTPGPGDNIPPTDRRHVRKVPSQSLEKAVSCQSLLLEQKHCHLDLFLYANLRVPGRVRLSERYCRTGETMRGDGGHSRLW